MNWLAELCILHILNEQIQIDVLLVQLAERTYKPNTSSSQFSPFIVSQREATDRTNPASSV